MVLLFSATAIAVQTPAPSLPANNAQNQLLNNLTFSWVAIPNANYRIVISEKQDFSGFNEQNSTCDSSCTTLPNATTPAAVTTSTITRISTSVNPRSTTAGNFSGFWWKAGTYYWRVRANTSAGGASAWSGFRTFTTGSTIQRAIVTAANNAVGNSPQSVTGSLWLTDMAGGDGNRIRTAITTFSTWVNNSAGGFNTWQRNRPAAPAATQTTMRANIICPRNTTTCLTPYSVADANNLIERIRLKFAGAVQNTDDTTLTLLGIRAQCKEFADRQVAAGSGTKKAYTAAGIGNLQDVTPGMYEFKTDSSHSAIINAVKWDNAGNVTNVRVTESNWGNGWTNPGGQVPWSRTVTSTREIPMTGYKAVTTE